MWTYNFYIRMTCITSVLSIPFLASGCKQEDKQNPTTKEAIKARIDQMLSDRALEDLVQRRVDKNQLIALYGAPVSAAGPNGIEILIFDFTVKYPFLRNISGRTGISATLKDGILIDCQAVTMTIAK